MKSDEICPEIMQLFTINVKKEKKKKKNYLDVRVT